VRICFVTSRHGTIDRHCLDQDCSGLMVGTRSDVTTGVWISQRQVFPPKGALGAVGREMGRRLGRRANRFRSLYVAVEKQSWRRAWLIFVSRRGPFNSAVESDAVGQAQGLSYG